MLKFLEIVWIARLTFFMTGSQVRQQKLWLSSHTTSALGWLFVNTICTRRQVFRVQL